MATVTETKKRCDVYGTAKNVESYRVEIVKRDDENTPDDGVLLRGVDIDLSPRAYDRLIAFLERGTTAPGAGQE